MFFFNVECVTERRAPILHRRYKIHGASDVLQRNGYPKASPKDTDRVIRYRKFISRAVYTNGKWEDPEDIVQRTARAAVGTTNYLYFLFQANIMPLRSNLGLRGGRFDEEKKRRRAEREGEVKRRGRGAREG